MELWGSVLRIVVLVGNSWAYLVGIVLEPCGTVEAMGVMALLTIGSQHWMRTEPRPWSTTYRNYSKELDVNSSGNKIMYCLIFGTHLKDTGQFNSAVFN